MTLVYFLDLFSLQCFLKHFSQSTRDFLILPNTWTLKMQLFFLFLILALKTQTNARALRTDWKSEQGYWKYSWLLVVLSFTHLTENCSFH